MYTPSKLRTRLNLGALDTLPSYAWPGGYPIVYYSEDGSEWCPKCANQSDADPDITEYGIHYEGAPIVCNGGCGNVIESAYGDLDIQSRNERADTDHAEAMKDYGGN